MLHHWYGARSCDYDLSTATVQANTGYLNKYILVLVYGLMYFTTSFIKILIIMGVYSFHCGVAHKCRPHTVLSYTCIVLMSIITTKDLYMETRVIKTSWSEQTTEERMSNSMPCNQGCVCVCALAWRVTLTCKQILILSGKG